ncbi:zinc finger protein 580 [Dromiciops gliroides]|uniref:zinc finger protein 580 n=1 Tax=Dromiciops gliroides TaxID=33562 RepID=UPI001CC34FCE|nr:zinc finger protein 580 [Dromiciops gliroides]XP_043850578.1 zinc finger protein 580 [Dromiciops gliroides]
MDAPPSKAASFPKPEPSASAISPSPRPGRYLLIDANGVPYTYTMLVEDEPPRASPKGEAVRGELGPGCPAAPRKGYSCPECGRAFESPLRLQSHRISHSDLKPFICGACGKAFKRSSHLSRHRSMHQPGGSRCHACPLCPRRFRDAVELAQHFRDH